LFSHVLKFFLEIVVNHLILGLPFLLLEYSLPFNIFFSTPLSSILSTCPHPLILCDLINLTISSILKLLEQF
jgi:hypothetical protein